MAEKLKFMVFKLLFDLKCIFYKDDIWQVETYPGVLLEERKLDILK